MSSENYPLRTSGIYRNLPNFDPSIRGLKALVCGGTGISGFHAVRALLDTPDRWSVVYLLSRSPLPRSMAQLFSNEQKARIQHVSADLTSSPDEIATIFKDAEVRPDHIFFYSYMSPKSGSAMNSNAAEELAEVNVPLFNNLLKALPKANIQPKRILLQTGGKNYGMHIGRTRNPVVESDPQPSHLQPNFYYDQERLLFDYCATHPETNWNVVRPCAIIGSVNKTWMNCFYSFAVYAAVKAHLNEPLEFGGDFESWQYPCTHSSARMTGYLSEWAVLEEKCANQAFNASDGSPLSWERFFEALARWYGVEKGVVMPSSDEERQFKANMTLAGGQAAPLGYGPPIEIRRTFALADWAKESENRNAWVDIQAKSEGKLNLDPFASEEDIASKFQGDFAYLRFCMSHDKVRRHGFNGYVDALETVFEMYQEMALMGMLPPMSSQSSEDEGPYLTYH